MLERRIEESRKLRQPVVIELENIIRDDLGDLRSMLAREYLSLIGGLEDAAKFHHMSSRNNDSLSDKDRRLFEMLICMSSRVVWIALQRKHLTLIGITIRPSRFWVDRLESKVHIWKYVRNKKDFTNLVFFNHTFFYANYSETRPLSIT